MTGTLDDRYLTWLYRQVQRRGVKAHWKLLRQMYATEFVWFIPNDDNRAEDGRDLRQEFLNQQVLQADRDWLSLGCSFLEMLVALSRRLEFEAEGRADEWFWHLVRIIRLDICTDGNYIPEYVEAALDTVIWRTYEPSGLGGLFPLKHPAHDQTNVEIWYQLSEWLLERQ